MKKDLIKNKTKYCLLLLIICASFLFSSCISLSGFLDYTDDDGDLNVGKILSVGEAVVTGVENISKVAEGIPPETEYAIGRSAAATILESYTLYENEYAANYLNKICSVLTMNSEKPFLYKGYFVAILDTPEINAISTPGGHIFISKGILDCVNSEDALAAVIAHELSHIQIGHSKQAIEGERGLDVATSALSLVLAAGGEDFTVEDVKSLNNSSDSFLRKIMRNGFSQEQEFEADENAIKLMINAGYNPYALIDMLEEIKKNETHTGLGWEKTHPDPIQRIREVNKVLKKGGYKIVDMSPREERFNIFKNQL